MSLRQRWKRRRYDEAQHRTFFQLLMNLDADFRFELACNGEKATKKKYTWQQLRDRYDQRSYGQQTSFMVPQGVSQVHVMMVVGGGGGGQ